MLARQNAAAAVHEIIWPNIAKFVQHLS